MQDCAEPSFALDLGLLIQLKTTASQLSLCQKLSALHVYCHAVVATQLSWGDCWAQMLHINYSAIACGIGNVIFLPRGAVVIDIVPENNEDKSPWVVYMCADFKPLFISPITIPPQKTVLQMAKVRRTKEWAMLTPYWRQRILREGVCPKVHPGVHYLATAVWTV